MNKLLVCLLSFSFVTAKRIRREDLQPLVGQRVQHANVSHPVPQGHIHPNITMTERRPVRTKSVFIPTKPTDLPQPKIYTFKQDEFAAKPPPLKSKNIFKPMSNDSIPGTIPSRSDHPLKPRGIAPSYSKPIQTNKFYGNFFLGNQSQATWTHPYSVWWAKGHGDVSCWGLAIAHNDRNQVAFGPDHPPSYYINPLGIRHLALSATQLTGGTTLTGDTLEPFSVNIHLTPPGASSPAITFPLVQGQGFITAIYYGAQPLIQSGVGITTLAYVKSDQHGTYKYKAILNNGITWLIYVTPKIKSRVPILNLVDAGNVHGPKSFAGTIQVAKLPVNGSSMAAVYDASAGVYPTSAAITGAVHGGSGAYTLWYYKGGHKSKTLLTWALPHHQESFNPSTRAKATPYHLVTTTKGYARAVVSDSLTMLEPGLLAAGFSPSVKNPDVSDDAASLIRQAAKLELSENIVAQTNLNSMYFSGKALAKFAMICVAARDVGKDATTAAGGLTLLKQAFHTFVSNQQQVPLAYDQVYGGVVSTASYATGDPGADFGNTFYNDHHFHYGYHVYTAAAIASLDPGWLKEGINKAWVDSLVRDYANPSLSDPHFPFSRNFDWFHGHSWAQGLFESADGKNQESSSEDTFATYALMMWGLVTGDADLRARAAVQLAIQKRALRHYYLMQKDNRVQPPPYRDNRAAGIIFENKCDHTTYFGTEIEFIEGIHMIPISPVSAYTRGAPFVREEWNQYFAGGIDAFEAGWQGILKGNQAIFEPKPAYEYFAADGFDYGGLDGGASRTWFLAYTAQMGGALAR